MCRSFDIQYQYCSHQELKITLCAPAEKIKRQCARLKTEFIKVTALCKDCSELAVLEWLEKLPHPTISQSPSMEQNPPADQKDASASAQEANEHPHSQSADVVKGTGFGLVEQWLPQLPAPPSPQPSEEQPVPVEEGRHSAPGISPENNEVDEQLFSYKGDQSDCNQ